MSDCGRVVVAFVRWFVRWFVVNSPTHSLTHTPTVSELSVSE